MDPPCMSCSEAMRSCGSFMGARLVDESVEEVTQSVQSLLGLPSTRPVMDRLRGKARGGDREREAVGMLAAMVMYTFDVCTLDGGQDRGDSFYDLLNAKLRERSQEESVVSFLYYLLNGLDALPSFAGLATLYRGVKADEAKRARLAGQYLAGVEVHWSGLTSTSKSREVAQTFAGPGGVLFCIAVLDQGRSRCHDVSDVSLFGYEEEVILMPNFKLVVTRPLELDRAAGVWTMQLQEMAVGPSVHF
jgi:hypothetical protein